MLVKHTHIDRRQNVLEMETNMNRMSGKVLLDKYIDSIYIYGAGNVGKTVCEKLQNVGYMVQGFIDSNEKIKTHCGHMVETLENFEGNLDGLVII